MVWLKLPGISTSYAARIIVLASFSLAVVGAYGLDGLREDWGKKKISSVFPFGMIVGVFLIAMWSTVMIIQPFPVDKLLIAKRNLFLPTGLTFGLILLFFVGFIRKWKFIQHIAVGLFVVITIVDMLRYSTKWMPFDPREYVYPEVDVLSFLKKVVGRERIFGNLGGEVTNGFGLSGIEGYDAVYQKRYGEFIRSTSEGKIIIPERSVVQFPKIGNYTENALQILGVRYIVHRLSDGRFTWAYPYWQFPYYKSIYRDNYYEVFVNEKALPRAFLASAYSVADKDKNIIDTLYQKEFDPRETLVLEREPLLKPQSGEGSVKIMKYTANEVVLQSKSTVPKLLFLSDVYDNGWQATIDGQKTRIDRADYDFRVVALPAGEHTVRMVYWPKSFVIGLWLAGTGVVLLLILTRRHLVRRK